MENIIDVLVVGAGGAGLQAALSAKRNGSSVLVVSKTYPTHSQTVQAQGGINAARSENGTTIESHIEDTYLASKKLGNLEHIKIMCENASKSIDDLDKAGVPFNRNIKNHIDQRTFGGAQEDRTCYSSDYSGLKILHTLYDQCIKEEIKFLNEYILLNLIVENNEIQGITALELAESKVCEFRAKSVILATGGYCNLYNHFTTNSNSTTGDGIAAALRAGAKLSNMEFVQFHPTAMKGNNILISESARGEGGYLLNSDGERFIDELKARDEVARAIQEELDKGEEVYLDVRHLSDELINKKLPQEKRLAKEFLNIDICNELLPIQPSAHYSMGGILTNVSCETSIKNLFACGECAQSGIHGANRLGGNSLQEIITLGQIAGLNASIQASTKTDLTEENSEQYKKDKTLIEEIFEYTNQVDFYTAKAFMGKIFFKNIGLFRTEMNMQAVLKQVKQWQDELPFMGLGDKSRFYNTNLQEFIEFKNLLELAQCVTLSAMQRCESRGSHYRIDYPEAKEAFEKISVVIREQDSLNISFEEIR